MKQFIYITIFALGYVLISSNFSYFAYSGNARIGSQSVQYQSHVLQTNHAAPEQVAVYHFIGE